MGREDRARCGRGREARRTEEREGEVGGREGEDMVGEGRGRGRESVEELRMNDKK
jgi:hypothetical protein